MDFGTAEISFISISQDSCFVKRNFRFFQEFFGNTLWEVIYMGFWKRCVLFCVGGTIYVGLELLWRGKSHISMFVAGGLCFLLIGQLGNVSPRLPLIPRTLVGAGIITTVELGTGLLVNREFQVWDYRGLPGNFLGQICPKFILLWVPVSLAAILLYSWTDRQLDKIMGR